MRDPVLTGRQEAPFLMAALTDIGVGVHAARTSEPSTAGSGFSSEASRGPVLSRILGHTPEQTKLTE